jgi:hypothetical protein
MTEKIEETVPAYGEKTIPKTKNRMEANNLHIEFR